MNEKRKQFFKVPQDIKTMTDEQLDQWAEEILDDFIANDNHTKEK
jgi:hypothetical protein